MPRKGTASILSQLTTHCAGLHESYYSKCTTLLLSLSCAAVQAFSPHLAFSRPETVTDCHALMIAGGISNTHHKNKEIYICRRNYICVHLTFLSP